MTTTDRRYGVAAGVAIKAPVLAATTANITLSGEQTIDGVSCVTDDRVLVQNQTTASENGIYVVDTGSWSRAADFDGPYDVVYGTIIPINDGSVNAIRMRRVTNTGTITLGSTSLTFGNALYNNASGIQFLPAETGGVATTVDNALSVYLNVYKFLTETQIADVEARTKTLDLSTAMQAADTAAAVLGRILYFPAGAYNYSTTIAKNNNTIWVGDGEDEGGLLGTELYYTGTSDAVQVNNTINQSNNGCYAIHDMAIVCATATTGKAAFADVGSSHVTFRRARFVGNKYGLILDQSELVEVSKCGFASCGTGGLWLVNGADHTVGASGNYTNRITVEKCQFNLASTAGIYGIIDDGGLSHTFRDNNFNGCDVQMRIAGMQGGLVIEGNQMEGSGTCGIQFKSTTLSNAAAVTINQTASVRENYMTGDATACVTFEASCLKFLELVGNTFNCDSPTIPATAPGSYVNSVVAYNNINVGTGGLPFNNVNVGTHNSSIAAWTPTWTASGTAPAIGDATVLKDYTRNGNAVTLSFSVVFGASSTFGTGVYSFALPCAHVGSAAAIGSAILIDSSTSNIYSAVVYVGPGASTAQIYITASGATTPVGAAIPFTWAQSDGIYAQVTINGDVNTVV